MIDMLIKKLQDVAALIDGSITIAKGLKDDTGEPYRHITAQQTREERIVVSWTTDRSGEIDIEFYGEGEPPWRHSVQMYDHSVRAEAGQFPIDFVHNGEIRYGFKHFRIVDGDWKSHTVSTELKKKVSEPEKEISFVPAQKSIAECAGIEGIPVTATKGPSQNPADWDEYGVILRPGEIFGNRTDSVGYFATESGLGLFYRSKATTWTPGAGTIMGSIAASNDLKNWKDYPDNPVLYEPQPWQKNRNRVAAYGFVWDPGQKVYVCYYGDEDNPNKSGYYGQRATGIAWSRDLINWTYKNDGPLFMNDWFEKRWPELVTDDTNLKRWGRIYVQSAFHYKGKFYIVHRFTTAARSMSDYDIVDVVLESDNPFDGWKRCDKFKSIPRYGVVEAAGKFYSPTGGKDENGNRGCGILEAENFFGPYTNPNVRRPLFLAGREMGQGHPKLFCYRGQWGISIRVLHPVDRGDDTILKIGFQK